MADLQRNQKEVRVSQQTTRRQLQQAERKANYKIVKKNMGSWQGIIKKNREARHLDYTENFKVANFNLLTTK